MSDIVIKDMEMPFTCLTCDFHKCAGGVGDFCSLTKRRQFRFKNRPKDCPLIELPPHGDLIDRREAIIDANERAYDFWLSDDEVNATIQFLKEQPTIIPAKEGET